MAEVIWSRRSLVDLRDIAAYIARDDPNAADRVSRRLQEAGESLSHFPRRGRPYAFGVRALPTVAPYVIYYEVEDDFVFILTVRHGRRRSLKVRA